MNLRLLGRHNRAGDADACGRVRRHRTSGTAHLTDDELFILQDDDALDHVLELADIAGPVVRLEELPELVG